MKYVDRKMQDKWTGLENAGLEKDKIRKTQEWTTNKSVSVRPVFDGRKHNKQWTTTDNMQKKTP